MTDDGGGVCVLQMQGSLLMGGDAEGKVYFWNTSSGEAEAAVRVHEAAVNTIHYYNGRFYTGSRYTAL